MNTESRQSHLSNSNFKGIEFYRTIGVFDVQRFQNTEIIINGIQNIEIFKQRSKMCVSISNHRTSSSCNDFSYTRRSTPFERQRLWGCFTSICRGVHFNNSVCSGKIVLALKNIELNSYLTSKFGGFSKGNGNNSS